MTYRTGVMTRFALSKIKWFCRGFSVIVLKLLGAVHMSVSILTSPLASLPNFPILSEPESVGCSISFRCFEEANLQPTKRHI